MCALENHVASRPAKGIPTTRKAPPTAAALTSIGICGALRACNPGNQWYTIEATQNRERRRQGCCAWLRGSSRPRQESCRSLEAKLLPAVVFDECTFVIKGSTLTSEATRGAVSTSKAR